MSTDIVCDESCEKHPTGFHCDHWYDDLGCCWCENRTLNLVVIGDGPTEGSLEWLRENPPADGRLSEKPNPNPYTPTGMCGSRVKCEDCPSTFSCAMKAGEEGKILRARWAACRDAGGAR